MADKTPSESIGAWLRANGLNTGSLTGQDWPALRAAVEIVACYNHCDSRSEAHLISAFRSVVMAMLPHNRQLAYHAIASVTEWHFRAKFWALAQLPPLEGPIYRCKYE